MIDQLISGQCNSTQLALSQTSHLNPRELQTFTSLEVELSQAPSQGVWQVKSRQLYVHIL